MGPQIEASYQFAPGCSGPGPEAEHGGQAAGPQQLQDHRAVGLLLWGFQKASSRSYV